MLTDENPHGFHTLKEGEYPFVECATLADDIKYRGGAWQSDWHFVDKAWYDDDGSSNHASEDYPLYKTNPKNLTLVVP